MPPRPSARPESKREKEFRLGLARAIPRFPNNKATLQHLEGLPLRTVLVHYTNWAVRYVPPSVRTVEVESTASSEPRWSTLQPQIEAFLDKVRRGDDLTPHLSLDPHTRGFTPNASAAARWEDKDFMLNVMGYHHFHIGITIEPKGFVTRTNELVFAKVTRDKFIVVSIFDHSVFDMAQTASGNMTPERERLWCVFQEHSSRGLAPGAVYIPYMITTSGHALQLVHAAGDYARIVKAIDPQLDDDEFVRKMYEQAGISPPKKLRLKWLMNHLDLGLHDADVPMFFVLRSGHI
jgi:hypothetical protein